MFRHTFATDLLTRGIPIEDVSVLPGHKSVRITEAYYSHWIQLENGLTLTGVRCDNTDRDRFRAGRNHSSSPRPDDPWANYVVR